MALENMTSQFQPTETKTSNALANDKGLDSVTNAGSNLNLDDTPILSNALANDKGLETLTNAGSTLNIDGTPEDSLGLANGGVGLESMTAADSNFDIDTDPTNSNGLNVSPLSLGQSNLELQTINDLSSGLAKEKL